MPLHSVVRSGVLGILSPSSGLPCYYDIMIDFFISLVLTAIITVLVNRWFSDSGLNAFPVLTFLVIGVLSFFCTSMIHTLFFPGQIF